MRGSTTKILNPLHHLPITTSAAVSGVCLEAKRQAQAAYDYFRSQGRSRTEALGMVANIDRESQFLPDNVGDNGSAYGIGQWHPDRQKLFEQHMGKNIRDSTFAEQLQFYDWELKTNIRSQTQILGWRVILRRRRKLSRTDTKYRQIWPMKDRSVARWQTSGPVSLGMQSYLRRPVLHLVGPHLKICGSRSITGMRLQALPCG